jgi:hypothetical protein
MQGVVRSPTGCRVAARNDFLKMTSKNVLIVLLSVLLSVGASLWLTSGRKQEFAKVIQTRSIELVDDQHRVRGDHRVSEDGWPGGAANSAA